MEFFKALYLLIISQVILFLVIILRRKKLRRENKVFLVIYLISIIYCLLDRIQFSYNTELHSVRFLHFYHSAEPFFYLFFPTLYLYVKSVTQKQFELRLIQLIHTIPFFVTLIYLLFNFSFLSTEMKLDALSGGDNSFIPPTQTLLFYSVLLLQNIYLLIALYEVYSYQTKLKDYSANINNNETTPLYILLIVSLFSFILDFYIRKYSEFSYTIDLIYTINAIAIFYSAYNNPKVFLEVLPSILDEAVKNANNEFVKHINKYMLEEKVFLDPELSLNSLAGKLEISPRKLSGIINTEYKDNFFNFINRYRIEEAKKILVDPESKNKTILEILYEVGFNNKSAFNRVFKQLTGKTPSGYRKEVSG